MITEYDSSYMYDLSPTYKDNEGFWKYTPSGHLTVTVTKEQGKRFEVGKDYYLDISEVN